MTMAGNKLYPSDSSIFWKVQNANDSVPGKIIVLSLLGRAISS
jgi:hypothetical protein